MKTLFILVVSCTLSGCSAVTESTENETKNGEVVVVETAESRQSANSPVVSEKEYDGQMIDGTINKANYEFYNACIYRDPATWTGKTVGVLGVFPGSGPRARQYARNDREFYLEGSYNGHPIGIIVKIDHSLPMQVSYGKAIPVLFPLQEILVFGKLSGTENVLNESGYGRAMPILECLLIYSKDDYSFRRPLWVSSRFERIPEGTVTVDSLKYEFDKQK